MANKLALYVNNDLAHVVPANAHNLEKTLKSETIRRWCKEFRKIADAPPKGRNSVINIGYLNAIHTWEIYRAGKDVEETKPYFGEEAAIFILDMIILTTRDTRDPEETYEGD